VGKDTRSGLGVNYELRGGRKKVVDRAGRVVYLEAVPYISSTEFYAALDKFMSDGQPHSPLEIHQCVWPGESSVRIHNYLKVRLRQNRITRNRDLYTQAVV
jgi:hypothetical protein